MLLFIKYEVTSNCLNFNGITCLSSLLISIFGSLKKIKGGKGLTELKISFVFEGYCIF